MPPQNIWEPRLPHPVEDAYPLLRRAALLLTLYLASSGMLALALGLGAVPVPLWEEGIPPGELEKNVYSWGDGGPIIPIYTSEEIRRLGSGSCASYVGAVAAYALRRGMPVYALVSGRHAIAYLDGAAVDNGRVYRGLSLMEAAETLLDGEAMAIRLPWGPVFRLRGGLEPDPLRSLVFALSLPAAYLLLLRLHWPLAALLLLPGDAPRPARLLPLLLLALALLSAFTPFPF